MGQWLKATGGYTVEQIGIGMMPALHYDWDPRACFLTSVRSDNFPSGLTAFGIASTLIFSAITDSTRSRSRWPVLVYFSTCCVVSSICLLVLRSPRGLKFFAWYLSGASYAGQATTFAWANQICADDDLERGIVLASMKYVRSNVRREN